MLRDVNFHVCYPDAIRKLFDKNRDTDRLFCMTFKSNAHKTSPLDLERASNRSAAHRNLDRRTMGRSQAVQVTVWYSIPTTNTARAWREYLTPFADAAKDHTPPFHQYLDENDEPMIDFNALKTIDKSATGCIGSAQRSPSQRSKRCRVGHRRGSGLNNSTAHGSS